MLEFNVCMHVGSFNINIKIDKNVKKRNTNISRKFEHEERIKEAIEKRKDLSQSFYNNMPF